MVEGLLWLRRMEFCRDCAMVMTYLESSIDAIIRC